jgi:hypothetical protein
MFDLEVSEPDYSQLPQWLLIFTQALAQQCEEKQRWSFFFMSTPLNMPGEAPFERYDTLDIG